MGVCNLAAAPVPWHLLGAVTPLLSHRPLCLEFWVPLLAVCPNFFYCFFFLYLSGLSVDVAFPLSPPRTAHTDADFSKILWMTEG